MAIVSPLNHPRSPSTAPLVGFMFRSPTWGTPDWGTVHITSMRSPAQGKLRLSHLMDPFAGMGSDLGQAEGSSPARRKRMEDGVDIRNNNHDTGAS